LTKPRPGHLPSEAFAADLKASEIARTLADLHASGIEATYHTCDVTDPDAVQAVMGEVVSRYGRIDGIIHGAGVLRDGLLSQMTPDDLSTVADVKFLGAWNLFSAAERAGLRFFVGLSSVAAIQGNPGQTNYAAAKPDDVRVAQIPSPEKRRHPVQGIDASPCRGSGHGRGSGCPGK